MSTTTVIRRRQPVKQTPAEPPTPAPVASSKAPLRRAARPAPAKAVAAQVSRAAPTPGRLRFARSDTAASRAVQRRTATEEIDDQLKSVAILEAELDKVHAKLTEHHATIEAMMRENRISEHSDGKYVVAVKESFSRQSITIDPKKFKANVPDKAFWDSITVGVTKAREHIGEKELMRISDVVAGKSTGFVFSLSSVDKKKKK